MSFHKDQVVKVLFFVFLIAFSLVVLDAIKPEPGDINDALIDLRGKDFSKSRSIALNGQWNFYLEGQEEDSILVKVPGKWNNYQISQEKMGSNGMGVYTIRLLIDTHKSYYLKINNVYTAYSVYLNDQLLTRTGEVSSLSENHKPENRLKIISLRPDLAENELKFVVSNHSHYKGGIRENVTIGDYSSIMALDKARTSIYMLIIGFLLATGFIYFGIGYYTGREKTFFYLSLFLFALVARILFTADLLITNIFPHISWTSIIRGDYLSYYIAAAFFSLFVFSYLQREFNLFIKMFVAFYFLNSFIVLITPPYFFSRLLSLVNIFSLLMGLYVLYIIITSSFRDMKTGKDLLIATLLFISSAIIEIITVQLGMKVITSVTTGVILFVAIVIFDVNKNFSIKISSEREHMEFLEDISNKDGLTGLFNHRYICQRVADIQKNWSSSLEKKKYSFAMMDLDNFKNVNDTYGHKKGDLVLKETAKIIMENIRENDIASRYGGEEFLIIFNADIDAAFQIAERIRKRIEEEILARTDVYITISGGVVELTKEKQDVIREADQLLYKAKRTGKNKMVI